MQRNTFSKFLFDIKNGQIIAIVIDDTNPCRSILEGLLEPSHPFKKEVADEAAALFLSSFLGDTCLWDEKPLSFPFPVAFIIGPRKKIRKCAGI